MTDRKQSIAIEMGKVGRTTVMALLLDKLKWLPQYDTLIL